MSNSYQFWEWREPSQNLCSQMPGRLVFKIRFSSEKYQEVLVNKFKHFFKLQEFYCCINLQDGVGRLSIYSFPNLLTLEYFLPLIF